MIKQVELDLDGRIVQIETGRVAKQADGAVLVTMGDTVVLGTATMSKEAREGIDFFPLVCDYEERKYAVGKIPGGFVKRGGRPSDRAVLISRLIDRPLRPMFPSGMRNEVQVITMPMSVELENPPDILAMLAASAALSISRIPFDGPIGAVRICRIDGNFVINPSWDQIHASDINVVVAGTKDTITTLDVEADQVDESVILDAAAFGQKYIIKLIELQEKLVAEAGVPKADVTMHEVSAELLDIIRDKASVDISEAIQQPDKAACEDSITLLKQEIVEQISPDFPDQEEELGEAVECVVKEEIRKLILEKGIRPDGRKPGEIRQITCEVGLLPRVHGSGLFTRGQTQVMSCLTLGSLDDAQIVDTLEEDTVKRYMHYYNFPPYSVGEARPLRSPGRREIGHGALAEKALLPVIPSKEEFPYSLLMTSDVLESNGSTSMASTCGSTLALMDAGVKIKAPVAGAAMGLMTDGKNYVVLSDIQGMEDFSGDMDFKVAGTETGVTAIQMDCKIKGISHEVMKDALAHAKPARMHILGKMLEAISESRSEMSQYAPRVLTIQINPDKIGEVIGPGGKVIKKIEADTGASLSIEQDGTIFITAADKNSGDTAFRMVDELTREIKVGDVFTGKIVKTAPFGAFVELMPGRDGLVHISQLSSKRVEKVEDVVNVGDEITVRVAEINPQGKIGLTCKGMDGANNDADMDDGLEFGENAVPKARFRPRKNKR